MVTSSWALLDGGGLVVNLIRWDGNLDTFDPAPLVAVPYDPAVHVLHLDTATVNRVDLLGKVQAALAANAAFLALGSPTTGQAVTQVQRLTRENTALILFLLGAFDDITGT